MTQEAHKPEQLMKDLYWELNVFSDVSGVSQRLFDRDDWEVWKKFTANACLQEVGNDLTVTLEAHC